MTPRRAAGLITLLVAGGCHAPTPPAPTPQAAAIYAAAEAGQPLPSGALVGFVGRLEPGGYLPAPGVTVTLTDGARSTVTDSAGFYHFAGLTGGEATVEVTEPNAHPFRLTCRLSPATGTPRVNLPLVPTAPLPGQEPGSLLVAGVATDPRGAALPGGSIHLVDSLSHGGQGSSQRPSADGMGFFVCTLPDTADISGLASFTAYGRTPGGVPVESQTLASFTLGSRPTYAIEGRTSALLPAVEPEVVASGPTLVLSARRLPTRRDELAIRFEHATDGAEVLPDRLETNRLHVTPPSGWTAGPVRLLTLGLPSPDAFDTVVTVGP